MYTTYSRRGILKAGTLRFCGQAIRSKFALCDDAIYHPEGPSEALELLLEGNGRFLRETFQQRSVSLAELRTMGALRRRPFAAILTCTHLLLTPEQVLGQNQGALCVIAQPGNVASPEVIRELARAASTPSMKLVLVLGHGGCAIVEAARSERQQVEGGPLPYIAPALPGSRSEEMHGMRSAMLQAKVLREAPTALREMFKRGELGTRSAVYNESNGLVTMLPDDCPQSARFRTSFPHGVAGWEALSQS